MPTLIGITGRARAGKDTFAKALQARGYKLEAFADRLKVITATLAHEPLANFYDDALKEQVSPALGMSRRRAMQIIGTDMMINTFGPDIWVTPLINQFLRNPVNTAITDVRMPNEAAAVRAAGGIVVRIIRPGNVGLTGEAAAHSSEAGVPDDLVDIDVINLGSISDLHAEANKLLAGHLPIVRAAAV